MLASEVSDGLGISNLAKPPARREWLHDLGVPAPPLLRTTRAVGVRREGQSFHSPQLRVAFARCRVLSCPIVLASDDAVGSRTAVAQRTRATAPSSAAAGH